VINPRAEHAADWTGSQHLTDLTMSASAANGFSKKGQRSGHNIYLLDGAKVTDELFNKLVINPSVDSIQEFTFFFFSYEGQRMERSLTRTFSVPTVLLSSAVQARAAG
jgi:hypothetical protein